MASIDDVMALIRALRAEDGCPWDRKQTPSTLSVYLIEEVHELVEAIEADDDEAVVDELGDVFFQVLFLVFLFEQAGRLELGRVLERNIRKMVRRHPHVFGDDHVENAEQVKERWREIKRKEKKHQGSLMDSVPSGLPALMRAYRISERAAGIGFDWENVQGVMDQVESEWSEFKNEMADLASRATNGDSPAALEFGDVLFSLVNVARMAGFHPETALQRSTAKFVDRFKSMEDEAGRMGDGLARLSRDEMERLWEKVKSRQGSGERNR